MTELPPTEQTSKFPPRKLIFIILGILLAVVIFNIDSPLQDFSWTDVDGNTQSFGSRPAFAAGIGLLMAFLWITEAIPIHYTALLPLLLFPIFGVFGESFIQSNWTALKPYLNSFNFLFLGGMGIAAAMQQWNLHRRIALKILSLLGTRPSKILLGMILATGFISMWISNTATAAMMLPIGLAIITQIEHQTGGKRLDYFGGALMLAIAYGANVGGMGSKIGTGPNVVFCSQVSDHLGRDITFLEFFKIGLPFMVVFLPLIWLVLWIFGRRDAPQEDMGASVIRKQLADLGKMKLGERIVATVFVLTCVSWMFSSGIHYLTQDLFTEPMQQIGLTFKSKHIEAWAAILAFLSLMVIRVKRSPEEASTVPTLKLTQLKVIPWSTLILLGGGFSLAAGIKASGLSYWLGDGMATLKDYPPMVQFLGITTLTIFFGAIASNVATTQVMMVILIGAGMQDGMALMGAAALAASCDFMLPAGTPPNAIVFGSGYLTVPRMASTGFVLNVVAAILLGLWGYFGIRAVL